MVMKMLFALLLAFVICVALGKWYIPWLKKHSAKQPIKDEVAAIYAEKEPPPDSSDDERSEKTPSAAGVTDTDDPLVFKEKPYYTKEELKLYYQIAIDEATKHGDRAMAAHFRILLDHLENNDEEANAFRKFILGEKTGQPQA